jgi:uncharacterized membrane protein YeaQ/YmgE (transglycosylase-associated protein family)
MALGVILSTILIGFLIGGLARAALPGPDPMPFWFTVLLGLGGSLGGGAIAAAIYGVSHTLDTSAHLFVTLLLEIGVAVALLGAYRRYVQRRPLFGPEAHRFPTRGIGVARIRAQLRRLGIDPDRLARPTTPGDIADELDRLRDQRDRGELTEEEYEQARERLRRY